jgi:hypothetical protein
MKAFLNEDPFAGSPTNSLDNVLDAASRCAEEVCTAAAGKPGVYLFDEFPHAPGVRVAVQVGVFSDPESNGSKKSRSKKGSREGDPEGKGEDQGAEKTKEN